MSVALLLIVLASPCPLHFEGDLVVASGREIPTCLETVNGDLIVGTGNETLRFPRLTDVTGQLRLTVAGHGQVIAPRLERVHRGLEMQLRGRAQVNLPQLAHVQGALGLDLDRRGRFALLPKIRRHDGGLWIFGGGDAQAVLPHLQAVSGTLFIQPSGPIRGLLPALRRVGGHLVLSNGSHVTTAGFSALKKVDGGLYLFGGHSVALPALERVSGALAVRDAQVQSLSEVGIEGTEIGALLLRDNPRLEEWPSHLTVDPKRVQVRNTPGLDGKAPRD